MSANKQKLLFLLHQLSTYYTQSQTLEEKISTASVGWHIDHSILVINQIVTSLKQSDPNTYAAKFNMKRFLVFNLNRLPRGKAKAPKQVRPRNEFECSAAMAQMERAIQHVEALDQLNPNNYFHHPYFGNLNLKRTQKMLLLHTQHHLKIIADIVAI